MEYAEFETEYQRVVQMFRGNRSAMGPAIERLRELATGIEDDDREEAGWDIVALEDSIEKSKDDEPPSEIIKQLRVAYTEAVRDDGTTAERLTRAEEGILTLERISAGAAPEEELEIGALEHTLHMLASGLRLEVR